MTKRPGLLAAALLALPSAALALESGDLAKTAQNPVAAMISLPFQNNTLFGVGPDDDVANVLNIQPVIPVTIGDWNILSRCLPLQRRAGRSPSAAPVTKEGDPR